MQTGLRRPGGWLPRGRDAVAASLSLGAVGSAAFAFLAPTYASEAAWELPSWRFGVATAALLWRFGVALLRARPGLGHLVLAGAPFSVAGSVEGAFHASQSFAQFSEGGTPGDAAFGMIGLAVLLRTAIPAAILTLYAAAPSRRLGSWVAVVGWGIAIASVVGALLRIAREVDQANGSQLWGPWNELSYQLDEPIPLVAIAVLGLIGSLRAAALRSQPGLEPDSSAGTAAGSLGPSRVLIGSIGVAAPLWVAATIAYLNRAPGFFDDGDGASRVLFIPILAALVAIVAERWSRIVAWSAVAVTFESIAYLLFARGAADYVAYAITFDDASVAPMTVAFLVFVAAATLVVVLACAAMSIAVRAALSVDVDAATDRRWAVRGAFVGLALVGWFDAGAAFGSGWPVVLGAGLLPLYAMPFVIGLSAFRRLVPAVAEADRVATDPLRPLRYLETVVAEAFTRRAEHRRQAVDAERLRLGSELSDLQDAIRRLLLDNRLVLEAAPASAALAPSRPPAVASGLRRPSDRELDVINLLAAGASNEEIARELVLSLKTVETHLRRLFSRYDLANRTELAVLAVREGWVDAP